MKKSLYLILPVWICLTFIHTHTLNAQKKHSQKMKTIERNINSEILIKAPKEAIFKIVSDHEGTHKWIEKVKKIRLLKKGTPKNGKGAIREVNFKPMTWTTVQEEIVVYQEDSHFHYKIQSKMPGLVDHLGVWRLEETEDGHTKVFWEVKMEYKKGHWFTWFEKGFAKQFKKVQHQALNQLKKDLEEGK